MSTLLALTHEVTVHAAQAPPVGGGASGGGGEGILDWLTAKNSQSQALLRAVAVTIGILFVIMQAVTSRGAMARIIIALIAAGIFIWGTWSVTSIKDRIGNEVNGMAPVTHADRGDHTAPPWLPGRTST